MDPCVTKIERPGVKKRGEVHSVSQIGVGRVSIYTKHRFKGDAWQ
jgi:hypothetical protein